MSEPTLSDLITELRSLREEVTKHRTMGFSNGVEAWPQRIYIGQPEGSSDPVSWYRWNSFTRQVEVIHSEFLTGVIVGLRLDDSRTYKGKPNIKLIISVEADCRYQLISSYDNLFARSFLWGVHQAPLDRFRHPVNIQARPRFDKEAEKFDGSVWCNLNQGRAYLNKDYPQKQPEEFWADIRQKAIAKFRTITSPSSPPPLSPQSNGHATASNLDRFREISRHLGIPNNQANAFIRGVFEQNFPGRKTRDLIPAEVLKMRSQLLVAWGMKQLPEGWGNACRTAYLESCGKLDDEISDADLAQAWLAELTSLIAQSRN